MNSELVWTIDEQGFTFVCKTVNGPLDIEEWALTNVRLQNGKQAGLGSIFYLMEDETAKKISESAVFIPHEAIAKFDAHNLKFIGLPEPMPYSLSIEGKGLLTDNDFRFIYSLYHPEGRPVMGYKRTGAFLEVGGEQYIIADPYYPLITGMDSFNNTPPSDSNGRLFEWGNLHGLLPEDAKVNDYLKSMRIMKGDAFSLRPYTNERGEPDFDPVIVRRDKTDISFISDKESWDITEALPSARQDSFVSRFRKRNKVDHCYPIEGGWYLVLPDKVRNILSVVKKYQQELPDKRREFIKKPTAFFREILDDTFDEDQLETVFILQDDYSDRVKEIGVWKPKVLPYYMEGKNEWLPSSAGNEEEIGILIDNVRHKIEKNDVKELINTLEDAIEKGKTSVLYKEKLIPATEEALDSVKELERIVKIDPNKNITDKIKGKNTNIVPLNKDNLECLEFLEYEKGKRSAKSRSDSIPASLNIKLYSHQLQGFEWLKSHWINGNSGALLADDMGLGKTLQTLCFLAWLKEQTEDLHFLIVAPTGLLKNWIDEHNQWLVSPGLGLNRIEAYGATLKELRSAKTGKAKELEGGLPVLDINKLKKADWVLTTYETLRDYQHSFGKINWDVMILDEAQKIKNPGSLMTDAVKIIKANFVLALTGTPVENRLTDLWCIVDRIKPGSLKSCKDFISLYEKEPDEKNDPHEQRLELKKILTEHNPPPIMLRRMKQDHLKGLPEKKEYLYEITMPKVQAEAYKKITQMFKSQEGEREFILKALHELRRISLHPYITNIENGDENYIKDSAKLIQVFNLLDDLKKKNRKALIFIESRDMQGILIELIQRRYSMDKMPLLINGAVPGTQRKERVNIFQEKDGFDVMILSPKAGGVGLTLTAANHVIHLSRWWNPAVEDQCTDRVYRIGQNREVHVHYPMAIHPEFKEHSFDITLDNLLKRKRHLSRTILAPPEATFKEAEELFKETVYGA